LLEHIGNLLAYIRERLVPVIHAAETTVHQMHGTSFTSYAAPVRGSKELCAWRIEMPAGTEEATAGDVILVPAGSRFGVDNRADEPATAWVTTSVGFAGILPDGSWIAPPWTR
jgi:hypothetical protein